MWLKAVGTIVLVMIAAIVLHGFLTSTPIIPLDIPVVKTIDPRTVTASYKYVDENGEEQCGLMMTDETFEFMSFEYDDDVQEDMRAQVDAAEAAGLRHYTVTSEHTDYTIENGIIIGSINH